MSDTIVVRNMSEYPQVLRRIFQSGERRSPRGIPTLDMGFASIVLLDATRGLPLGIGRNLNPAIGAVEAIQLIAGSSNPELVLRLAPQMLRYTDSTEYDDTTRMFWGAYGERIKLQVYAQIRKLLTDPSTRQAVITLWDPWLDNVDDKNDYPCTIALQFSIHSSLLDMNVIMRSSDAWLGLPYDVFQFTQLQQSVAYALNTTPGIYRHTTFSLHLYEHDMPVASDLIDEFSPHTAYEKYNEVFQPASIGLPGQSFVDIMRRAQRIIDNEEINDETPSERWYQDVLHSSSSNVG